MKRFLMLSALVLSLTGATVANATTSDAVFYDRTSGKLYYKGGSKGNTPVWIEISGKDGKDGKSAYEIAVVNGFDGDETDWLESLKGVAGLNGNDGKSAYELALESGFTGNVDDWLNSLIGESGSDGSNGKSAYEIAREAGFEGTESEWLESLKGADGSVGNDGKSAYDLAVEAGFEGTEAEFLESLKGEKGDKGEKGEDAKGEKGDRGEDGKDGKSFDAKAYASGMAVTTALGGLELRQGKEGVTSWSAGIGIFNQNGVGTEQAISFGIHYGITDNLGIYAKVSHSFSGKATAAFVGIEGQF